MSFESSLNLKPRLLLDGLRVGELHRLDNAMLDPQALADVLGADDFAQLEQDMNHEARLLQLDAVARFCLQILDSALVGQGEDGLLGPVADEVHGLGKFPYLRALCAFLEPDGDIRSGGDVIQRVPEQFPLGCDHDASPLNARHALYTALTSILGENGGDSFSAAPTNTPTLTAENTLPALAEGGAK